ncbi:MAG: DUF4173 domain-containing protein [Bacteroidota bacterium]
MHRFRIKSAVLFFLGAVYALLFYHAELGLNLLLFDGLLIGLTLWLRPELARHRGFVWSVGGLLFAAGSVVLVHGSASMIAHHLTYLLVVGFARERELRFVWFGLLLGGISLFQGPIRWGKRWRTAQAGSSRVRQWSLDARIGNLFVAAAIFFPFLGLYLAGNGRFFQWASWLADALTSWKLNPDFIWRCLLCVFGSWLCITLFFPHTGDSRLVFWQSGFRDELLRERVKNRTQHQRPRPRNMALKYEYQQSVIVFGALNLLLAVVNATDLRYVWLPGESLSAATLSKFVHEGTTNLSFAVVLAMLVVLFYFRGNLNFLGSAPALRPLARVWLAQNALLAVSVGLRNWHYINAYGLALGRVYVIVALLLILFGLLTLWRKIDRRLSVPYLLQTNGMAVWLALLLFGAVNWSGVITRYNLATQAATAVDWEYLSRGLDRRNTLLLVKRPDYPKEYWARNRKYYGGYTDWRSWNYADWRNYRALR